MQVKCNRCGELECICGDPALEAWIEQELENQDEHTELISQDGWESDSEMERRTR